MLLRCEGSHVKQDTAIHIVGSAARDITWVRIVAKQMVPWSSWIRMACSSELFLDRKNATSGSQTTPATFCVTLETMYDDNIYKLMCTKYRVTDAAADSMFDSTKPYRFTSHIASV